MKFPEDLIEEIKADEFLRLQISPRTGGDVLILAFRDYTLHVNRCGEKGSKDERVTLHYHDNRGHPGTGMIREYDQNTEAFNPLQEVFLHTMCQILAQGNNVFEMVIRVDACIVRSMKSLSVRFMLDLVKEDVYVSNNTGTT
jgi:hypothetical protein